MAGMLVVRPGRHLLDCLVPDSAASAAVVPPA